MSAFERLGAMVSLPSTDDAHADTSRTDDTASDPDVDIDTALSLLTNERRRLAIRFVVEQATGEFGLDDIADALAAIQYGPEYTSSERKREYISLYQHHVSTLVAAGVLDAIDEDGGEAHRYRRGEHARAVYDVLDAAATRLGGEA